MEDTQTLVKKRFIITGPKLRDCFFDFDVPYIPATRQLMLSHPLVLIAEGPALTRNWNTPMHILYQRLSFGSGCSLIGISLR